MTQDLLEPKVSARQSADQTITYVYASKYDHTETVRDLLETLPAPSAAPRTVVRLTAAANDYVVASPDLLPPDQEHLLFDRMNCLKHLAWKRLSRDGASAPPRSHRAARALLASAQSVRDELMLANQRLIVSIASGYQHQGVPLEDLIAEGNVVLCRAVDRFDCHRGYRFSTYATHAVRNHLTRFVRRMRGRLAKETLAEPLVIDQSARSDAELPSRAEASALTSRLISFLATEERGLLELRFGLGHSMRRHTFRELGQMYGVTGEWMRQRVTRILNRLQQFARDNGLDREPS